MHPNCTGRSLAQQAGIELPAVLGRVKDEAPVVAAKPAKG
jgi:hypothetical protein